LFSLSKALLDSQGKFFRDQPAYGIGLDFMTFELPIPKTLALFSKE